MKFQELNLETRLLRGIADRGYTEMTEVQEKTFSHSLKGKDVAVQSQTGTGKTAAFLITLFQRMLRNKTSPYDKALIIVPTRELAVQIEKEAKLLNKFLGFSIASFYGGVGYGGQLTLLEKGVDIAIGTPGRLIDFSKRGRLKLGKIGFFVIDEADRLLDMGFLPEITQILTRLPARQNRQNMMFSATLNRISVKIAYEHMNHPESVIVNPEHLTVETVSQELYHVYSHIKMNLMLGILKDQSPQNALIFTNMKHAAFRLSKKLQHNGYRSQHLTGDLPQNKRLRIIQDFKAGKFPILVATDVAARGLQIDNLEMVINYDLPQEYENYVHRIGRTARAGNVGKAISLVSEGTAGQLAAIESFIGMRIPVRKAESDSYATDNSLAFDSGNKYRKQRPKSKTRRKGYNGSKKNRSFKRHSQPSPSAA